MLELRKQEDPKIRFKSKYKTLVKIFTDLNSMNNKRYKYNNNYRINFTGRIFKIWIKCNSNSCLINQWSMRKLIQIGTPLKVQLIKIW